MSPRVTIGLPVYNGEKYIDQALNSLRGQTMQDFELLISDNASTDRTVEICQEHAASDSRIQVFQSAKNAGAARNFNHLVGRARAPYFKWAAHDDICAANYLSSCVQVLDADTAAVTCHSASACIDAHNNVLHVYDKELSFDHDSPHQRFQAIINRPHFCLMVFGLIRTEILKRTALIGPYVGSDRNLLAELGLYGKLLLVPETLFYRRSHEDDSQRANETPAARAAWFDPANSGRPVFSTLRRLQEYMNAVERMDFPDDERQHCQNVLQLWQTQGRHHRGWHIAEMLKQERVAMAEWEKQILLEQRGGGRG